MFKISRLFSLLFLYIFLFSACNKKNESLPFLGLPTKDGLHPSIPTFKFVNQNKETINPSTFKDCVYLANFFFTSCPTICPKVTSNMLKIYRAFEKNRNIKFISHSIDVRHDSVPILKNYADKLLVDHQKWHFVTGDKDQIFRITKDYMSIALEDPEAPGGFDHSGYILLVDKNFHIRSYIDGTKDDEVEKMIKDINTLLNEK